MIQEALQNIRVLDLSRILAGPWCTQMFADLGAEVIKIEHPERGDDTRHLGPPWMTDSEGKSERDATYYASANRGKKSVGVDISAPEGAQIVRDLAATSDIFIENFKVGNLARYKLDYESIKAINPSIIYCSITGYGQTGPYSKRPGYDFAFQAEGGLMSITGERDDLPGGGPQKSGVAIADLTTGLYASTAILAALNYRNVTGLGQFIDMSLLDCVTALASNQGTSHIMNGVNPKRLGNAHPALVPYQVFNASDGYVVVAVANDFQWQRLCTAIGREDLKHNDDFMTASGRIENRDALIEQVQNAIRTKSVSHWLQVFDENDVPHGKINSYKEVFEHPQITHRNMVVDVKNEDDDAIMKLIGCPIKLSQTPVKYKFTPPSLGRHTNEILSGMLHLDETRLAHLASLGVIRSANKKTTA